MANTRVATEMTPDAVSTQYGPSMGERKGRWSDGRPSATETLQLTAWRKGSLPNPAVSRAKKANPADVANPNAMTRHARRRAPGAKRAGKALRIQKALATTNKANAKDARKCQPCGRNRSEESESM